MKLISKLVAVAVVSVGMLSCSNNEETPLELKEATSLVEEITIAKDMSGRYSLNYNLDNASADVFTSQNSKEFVLFPSNKKEAPVKESLIINKQYTLSFVNSKSNKKTQMTIIDDNMPVSSKGNYLTAYTMKNDGGATFTLDFKVAKGLQVNYVYNKVTKVYEIHLAPGKSKTSTFTKNFVKKDGEDLKIDFINHTNSNAMSKPSDIIVKDHRKPRWIINT